jgi:hypothetical protein
VEVLVFLCMEKVLDHKKQKNGKREPGGGGYIEDIVKVTQKKIPGIGAFSYFVYSERSFVNSLIWFSVSIFRLR